MTHALELSAVSKSFDGFAALTDAHFDLRWGEVHALLGENGAGKSTLMNIAAGLYAPETGIVQVNGKRVWLESPREATSNGIGMVHQHFKLVRTFTVAENALLSLPDHHPLLANARSHPQRIASVAKALAEHARRAGLALDPHSRIDTLSVAEQQRAEILKVLVTGARIVILDEPTAVLTDEEGQALLSTMRELARRQNAAIVLVTHRMPDVKAFADRVTVMRGGRTVSTCDPKEVSVNDLVQMTVGQTLAGAANGRPVVMPGETRISVRNLRTATNPALAGISFSICQGEIYGLAGVGGNGQSELVAALQGMVEAAGGSVEVDGTDITDCPPALRSDCGIAVIPADRYGLALAGDLSIAENFGIGAIRAGTFGSFFRVHMKKLGSETRDAVKEFDVQGVRSTAQKAALLSGGNAQKLVIAREFSRKPKLVIAHSPSRGLDVRASTQVHERLRRAARESQAAVLLISEDLDEVIAVSDRIGVISKGQIASEFQQPVDRQAIGHAMVHHE